MSPPRRRAAVRELQGRFGVSERRACRVLGQPRGTQRYRASPRSDEAALCRRLRELVRRRPRFGYRRLTAVLRREGWRVNAKRVHRLCRREGLKVRRRPRKRRAAGCSANACHVRRAGRKDQVWCWDFAFDRTTSGASLKWLSVVDEYTRECLALKVGKHVTGEDVIDTLAELFAMRGVPEAIRSDNGPEFAARAVREWLARLNVETLYVAPGSPWENGYAESFHSKLVDEFLAREEFEGLSAARRLTQAWREDYNRDRPHGSLGYLTPAEFAARCATDPLAGRRAASAPAEVGPALRRRGGLTQPELS